MRALAIGVALLAVAGLTAQLVLRDSRQPESKRNTQTVGAAGIALRVPRGWTGRAAEFDSRLRTPVVEVRRGPSVRIEVVELGNQPGTGRFRNMTLPIAFRARDVRNPAALEPARALVVRLFATRGRSFSVQAEVDRAALPGILREVNDVVATLGIQPPPGMDPATLAKLGRPLRVPYATRSRCPRTPGGRNAPGTAYSLGNGPAFPTIGPTRIAVLDPRTLRNGWYEHKTLWAVSPSYRGPLLIRGRRIDEPGPVRFALGGPHRRLMRWPGMWPAHRGWRYYPSTTALRGPGCYAFQVDGLNFSSIVVFEARL